MRLFLKILVIVSRVIVGSLFIVSGLIKMNDAYGFSYKLEEYFEPAALGPEWLTPYSLGLAIFICIAEVLLGVAVLVWAKQKLTSVLLLVMIVFFTWLTAYTDGCDPYSTVEIMKDGVETTVDKQCVLECGCFGNAIKLTPHQSYLKDLFLLVWILILGIYAFFLEKKEDFDQSIKANKLWYTITLALSILTVAIFSMKMLDWMFPVIFTAICLFVAEFIRARSKSDLTDWWVAIGITAVCCVFSYWTYNYLPMKDYRPYAVGEDLKENMKSTQDLIDEMDPFLSELNWPASKSEIISGVTKADMPDRLVKYLIEVEDEGQKYAEFSEFFHSPIYETEFLLKNIKTGADTTMMSGEWLLQQGTDHFKATYEVTSYDGREILTQDGYEPRILDFVPTNDIGEEMTESLLNYPEYTLMVISKDSTLLQMEDVSGLVDLYKAAEKSETKMVVLLNDTRDNINKFKSRTGLDCPYYITEGLELKTMIRSNPGLVLMKNGMIEKKWSWKGLPDYEDISFD